MLVLSLEGNCESLKECRNGELQNRRISEMCAPAFNDDGYVYFGNESERAREREREREREINLVQMIFFVQLPMLSFP